MFVGRAEELDALDREWSKPRFSFIVIYGRRRIGKTELIKQFSRDKPHIYILAPQDTKEMQRSKLLEIVSDHFGERKPAIDNWRGAIGYLKEKLEEETIVLSIDEFPYLVESNRSVPSYFQELIDTIESNSMLILCGSSISVMESAVMGHKSPLYGRRTGQIDLQPFDFSTSLEVIDYPFQDAVRSYSLTGGAPMYLMNYDYTVSLEANIREKILDKTSFMYQEPEFMLRTELRNPNRYMSILEAIAAGHTRSNRISNVTAIATGPLSNYLSTLRRLRLIEREIPVTAERKKSKRSRYRLRDNFFRFWFQFVEPKRSWIEENAEVVLTEEIMPSLDRFASTVFEDICLEAVWKLSHRELLPTKYSKIGRWWYKDSELDIVGLNEKRDAAIFGECKWTKKPIGYAEIKQLKDTAKKVRWKNNTREESYILFSRSGFKDNAHEVDGDVRLYDLENMKEIFKR